MMYRRTDRCAAADSHMVCASGSGFVTAHSTRSVSSQESTKDLCTTPPMQQQRHHNLLLRPKKRLSLSPKKPSDPPPDPEPSEIFRITASHPPTTPHHQHPMDDEFGVRSMDDLTEYSSDWGRSDTLPGSQDAEVEDSDAHDDRAGNLKAEEEDEETAIVNADEVERAGLETITESLDVTSPQVLSMDSSSNAGSDNDDDTSLSSAAHSSFPALRSSPKDPLPSDDPLVIATAFAAANNYPTQIPSRPVRMPFSRSIPPTPVFTPTLSKQPSTASTIDLDPQPGSPRSYLSGPFSDEISRGEASGTGAQTPAGAAAAMYESASDLVMPTVTVSRRRAPTPRGQDVGYLKVLVAGDSGIGKSRLIRILTHSREVIAYDHYSSRASSPFVEDEGDGPVSEENGGLREYRASTMVTPAWDRPRFQEGDVGIDEVVPVKNLCFVDTVGYGVNLDVNAVISPVTEYVETQFRKTNAIFHPMMPNNQELVRFLINPHGAHSHTDACLYLILHRTKPVDFEYMRNLHDKCNVIPVIVKSDTLSAAQVTDLKLQVLRELHEHGINFFDFGYSFEQLWEMVRRGDPGGPPFAISTLTINNAKGADGSGGSEDDVCPSNAEQQPHASQPQQYPSLDPDQAETSPVSTFASSSSVFPNLVPSDLSLLHDLIFYTHIDTLRHATATKFIDWRASQSSQHPFHHSHSLGLDTSLAASSFLSSSYLGDSSDQDRVAQFKTQEARRMSLHVARYIADKRREMERRIVEGEHELVRELGRTERARRAAILVTELQRLMRDEYGAEGSTPGAVLQQAREQGVLVQRAAQQIVTGMRRRKSGSAKGERERYRGQVHQIVVEPDPLGRLMKEGGRVVKIAVVCAMFWLVWKYGLNGADEGRRE